MPSRLFMHALACLGCLAMTIPAAGAARAGEADGVGIWNTSYMQTVRRGDFAGGPAALAPVKLSGPRNGAVSGCVVLVSKDALRGIKASAQALTHEDGKSVIEARQVVIRYAAAAAPEVCFTEADRFDGLLEAAPAEVPALDSKGKAGGADARAIVPVWMTVNIPKTAAPGKYSGKVAVEAGGKTFSVEVQLVASDWVLPDTKDYKVRNMGVILPDRVTEYYNVPAWSDKYNEHLGRVLELSPYIGSRQLVMNMVVSYPAMSNKEAMVRFVKDADGKYTHDFTAFDKYLELADKRMGKPFPIRLNMWAIKSEKDPSLRRTLQVVDKASGQASEVAPPDYDSPEFWPLWKPVLDQVKERLDKRQWFDVTAVNWFEYCGGPSKPMVSGLKAVWPDGKWASWDHGRRYPTHAGEKKEDAMPILVNSSVWNEGHLTQYAQWDGKSPGPRGFKRSTKWVLSKPTFIDEPKIGMCGAGRDHYSDRSTMLFVKCLNEDMIMRGQHGIDSFGINYWPVKDAKGRFTPGSINAWAQGPSHAFWAIIAAGPNGPVATDRFEAMREGVQVAEAMLYLQRALDDNKATGELAAKIDKLLDARAQRMVNIMKAGEAAGKEKKRVTLDALYADELAKDAAERDAELYALCGEVSRAIEKK